MFTAPHACQQTALPAYLPCSLPHVLLKGQIALQLSSVCFLLFFSPGLEHPQESREQAQLMMSLQRLGNLQSDEVRFVVSWCVWRKYIPMWFLGCLVVDVAMLVPEMTAS
jgi:hypothetical protein